MVRSGGEGGTQRGTQGAPIPLQGRMHTIPTSRTTQKKGGKKYTCKARLFLWKQKNCAGGKVCGLHGLRVHNLKVQPTIRLKIGAQESIEVPKNKAKKAQWEGPSATPQKTWWKKKQTEEQGNIRGWGIGRRCDTGRETEGT